jgi:hypothetical protein
VLNLLAGKNGRYPNIAVKREKFEGQ